MCALDYLCRYICPLSTYVLDYLCLWALQPPMYLRHLITHAYVPLNHLFFPSRISLSSIGGCVCVCLSLSLSRYTCIGVQSQYIYIRTHPHTHARTSARARTRTRTQTQKHKHTHAHTHTRAHTHTYTYKNMIPRPLGINKKAHARRGRASSRPERRPHCDAV